MLENTHKSVFSDSDSDDFSTLCVETNYGPSRSLLASAVMKTEGVSPNILSVHTLIKRSEETREEEKKRGEEEEEWSDGAIEEVTSDLRLGVKPSTPALFCAQPEDTHTHTHTHTDM